MKSSIKLTFTLVTLCSLAAARPGLADPQAVILSPVHSPLFVKLEPVSFDVTWTVTLSGAPLDHYATQIVSQLDIQNALGLGGAPPNAANLQQYFGSQAPGFAGWAIHPPDETSMHVEGIMAGQVYFLALTAVDQSGGYDGVFDLSRNLLRFKMTTELQPPTVGILSPTPSSSTIVSVPASFDVHWLAQSGAGTFLDHSATLIVTQHDIQQALGLGNALPTDADLQTYFGGQAPAYVGWTVHPPSETTQHVDVAPDGQLRYFALGAVDDIGGFVSTFLLTRNVLRFMPPGPVPDQMLTWGAIKASRR